MKPKFLTSLLLEDIDGKSARLYGPLKFYSLRHKGIFMVEPGFETDFASIPRGLWNVLPKRGLHDAAAVLHDASYRGELKTVDGRRVRLTQKLADLLFLEGMEAKGVNWFSRKAMYLAVRLFGSNAYKGVPSELVP